MFTAIASCGWSLSGPQVVERIGIRTESMLEAQKEADKLFQNAEVRMVHLLREGESSADGWWYKSRLNIDKTWGGKNGETFSGGWVFNTNEGDA